MMDTPNSQILNGFFELKFQEDGIYLIVYPPATRGAKVTVAEVLDKLAKKKVRNFDRSAIDATIAGATKIPEKIAEPQEEERIDSTMVINIAPDKMKVQIMLTPPDGGRMLTVAEMENQLEEAGVKYGIKKDYLNELVRKPVFIDQVVIAEGTPAINGANGKLEFHFKINRNAKPTINEDGTVNFRELNIIENVQKGQILVTAKPPSPGTPGTNVLGISIPALDGKPAILPKGRNVEVSEDETALLAGMDGHVNYIDGKVSVFSLYEVQADVDNSTGNINFIGNVIVRGNVLSGFSIEAGGNVEVFGVVEGATIRAGGNIVLRRGMQGVGKGTLTAEGDIVSRYIEHSNIYAKGDIKAEAIMHSNIRCGNRVELGGKKGLLVGGTAKVAKEISAKVIGSPMATITDIEVGVDPTLRERYKIVKEEIGTAETNIRKSHQAIEILRKIPKLPLDKQEIMERSIRTIEYYNSKLGELKEEIVILNELLEQESSGRILAQNIIYPGTRVAIGTCLMNVRENLQYCVLYRDGADIKVGAYNK